MIADILAFITKWKWIVIGIGASLVFSGGFYLRGLLYDASELEKAKIQLQAQEELSRVYRQASTNYQKLNQALLSSNQDLMDKANELPQTNCDKLPISGDKLQLLKAHHATLAAR